MSYSLAAAVFIYVRSIKRLNTQTQVSEWKFVGFPYAHTRGLELRLSRAFVQPLPRASQTVLWVVWLHSHTLFFISIFISRSTCAQQFRRCENYGPLKLLHSAICVIFQRYFNAKNEHCFSSWSLIVDRRRRIAYISGADKRRRIELANWNVRAYLSTEFQPSVCFQNLASLALGVVHLNARRGNTLTHIYFFRSIRAFTLICLSLWALHTLQFTS